MARDIYFIRPGDGGLFKYSGVSWGRTGDESDVYYKNDFLTSLGIATLTGAGAAMSGGICTFTNAINQVGTLKFAVGNSKSLRVEFDHLSDSNAASYTSLLYGPSAEVDAGTGANLLRIDFRPSTNLMVVWYKGTQRASVATNGAFYLAATRRVLVDVAEDGSIFMYSGPGSDIYSLAKLTDWSAPTGTNYFAVQMTTGATVARNQSLDNLVVRPRQSVWFAPDPVDKRKSHGIASYKGKLYIAGMFSSAAPQGRIFMLDRIDADGNRAAISRVDSGYEYALATVIAAQVINGKLVFIVEGGVVNSYNPAKFQAFVFDGTSVVKCEGSGPWSSAGDSSVWIDSANGFPHCVLGHLEVSAGRIIHIPRAWYSHSGDRLCFLAKIREFAIDTVGQTITSASLCKAADFNGIASGMGGINFHLGTTGTPNPWTAAGQYASFKKRLLAIGTFKGKTYGFNFRGEFFQSADNNGFDATGAAIFDIRDSATRQIGPFTGWNTSGLASGANGQSMVPIGYGVQEQSVSPHIIGDRIVDLARVSVGDNSRKTTVVSFCYYNASIGTGYMWAVVFDDATDAKLAQAAIAAGETYNIRVGLGCGGNHNGGSTVDTTSYRRPAGQVVFVDTGTYLYMLVTGRFQTNAPAQAESRRMPSTWVKWDGTNAPTYIDFAPFGVKPNMQSTYALYDSGANQIHVFWYDDTGTQQVMHAVWDCATDALVTTQAVAGMPSANDFGFGSSSLAFHAGYSDVNSTITSTTFDNVTIRTTVNFLLTSPDRLSADVLFEYNATAGWFPCTRAPTVLGDIYSEAWSRTGGVYSTDKQTFYGTQRPSIAWTSAVIAHHIAALSGSYYCEFHIETSGNVMIGLFAATNDSGGMVQNVSGSDIAPGLAAGGTVGVLKNSAIYANGSYQGVSSATFTAGDRIGVLVNAVTGSCTFHKNGGAAFHTSTVMAAALAGAGVYVAAAVELPANVPPPSTGVVAITSPAEMLYAPGGGVLPLTSLRDEGITALSASSTGKPHALAHDVQTDVPNYSGRIAYRIRTKA